MDDQDIKIEDIVNVVENLNQEIFENCDDDFNEFNTVLEVSSNGYCIVVLFMGHHIWSSDDDEREYKDTGTDMIYEPFEGFIRRKIMELVNYISQIKV